MQFDFIFSIIWIEVVKVPTSALDKDVNRHPFSRADLEAGGIGMSFLKFAKNMLHNIYS
jgi:hypothetical protein